MASASLLPAPRPSSTATTPLSISDATSAPGPAAASTVSPPVRVVVPSIGVDSALERLTIEPTGVLTPPVDFDKAGWFAAGIRPGAVGPAVIAGHVDSKSGPAVFVRLTELAAGAVIIVVRADGSSATFRVDAAHSYPKARFPTAAVYGPTPLPTLRLVTCTGDFDHSTGHYVDNFVVFAHLVG